MDARLPFILPLSGLKLGMHEYHLKVKDDFFDTFEMSLIKKGTFDVHLFLDICERMIIATFSINGTTPTECDRCAEEFNLPIKVDEVLNIKYTSVETEDDAEVVYLLHGTPELDLSTYIYEYIVLSIPFVKYHEHAGEECSEEILDLLDYQEDASEDKGDDDEEKGSSPWDALNDLKLN